MKVFCSFAYTGEDPAVTAQRMNVVVDALLKRGHEAYCSSFDAEIQRLQEQNDMKGVFTIAFKKLAASDVLVAIVASPNRSVGQLMEIGIALSQNKKVYLFEHASASGTSYLPQLIDAHYTWNSLDELKQALGQVA
jgi:nucleoside 2-deoxyribosyltransferase